MLSKKANLSAFKNFDQAWGVFTWDNHLLLDWTGVKWL
jgi:hypothetical protein